MGTVEITQRVPDAMIMRWDGFTAAALPEIRERVCRWLSIEWEPSAAIARLSGDLRDFTRIPVDSGVIAYLREHHGCSPAEYAASRSAWGPYLALGYKLARLREKLEAA